MQTIGDITMLQEVLTTVDQKKVERFTNYHARFLANVRSRVQATAESGDTEALRMLVASIGEILNAAMEQGEVESITGTLPSSEQLRLMVCPPAPVAFSGAR
jgi:hypothetical protein